MSLLRCMLRREWKNWRLEQRRWNMGKFLRYQGINISNMSLKLTLNLLSSCISINLAMNSAIWSTNVFLMLLKGLVMSSSSKLYQRNVSKTSLIQDVLVSSFTRLGKWCRIWLMWTSWWRMMWRILMCYWVLRGSILCEWSIYALISLFYELEVVREVWYSGS